MSYDEKFNRIFQEELDLLPELRRFKFVTTMILEFKKIESDDATNYSTFYSNSKIETIINESDIDDIFESIYTSMVPYIQNPLEKVCFELLIHS